jgi:hypothetical protein
MQFDFLPDYQCQFIQGNIASSGGPTRVGTVIVKRTWQRVSATVTQPDPTPIAIAQGDVLESGKVVFESDLALTKPLGDLVVLDFNAGDPAGAQYEVVRGSNRQQASTPPLTVPVRAIFGWSLRSEPSDQLVATGPRRSRAGVNLDQFNPNTMVLPQQFDNLFFNGMAAAPAAAEASDITLDTITGIGAGDLLRIDGNTAPAETEFSAVDVVIAGTRQVILSTPLVFSHDIGRTVARIGTTLGATLAVDTGRTMNAGENQLAVSDATALTLAANAIVRVVNLDNTAQTQYGVVAAAGSRTIRGRFRYTFDVNRVAMRLVTPALAPGEPPRRVAYATPFTYFDAGETLTLRRIGPVSPAPYAWKLPSTAPAASVTYREGAGVERTLAIALALDTVVLLRHSNQFYTVWRGTWNYVRPDGVNAVKDEDYVRLKVA